MQRIQVDLGARSYPIIIAEQSLTGLADYLGGADAWFVLTDANVDGLYSHDLAKALDSVTYTKLVIEAGETAKDFRTVETVINAMADARLTRHSGLISFGGGVVGDLGGFCASIYMRGIPCVQVPTTLLAQVDSSVGGKTGVNVRAGKNMAGTFYQPAAVIIDTALLETLPRREFTAGLGEVIKYGVIYDHELLTLLANSTLHRTDPGLLSMIVARCCSIKAEIVAGDETEGGRRKILNFGHTVGHALEAVTGYTVYLHGEAVLVGMYYETLLAEELGLIDASYGRQITNLIRGTGIDVDIMGLSLPRLVEQMRADKKNQGETISFILPTGPGQVVERQFAAAETLALLDGLER